MKKIDWEKLCYSVMLGLLLSTGIVLLSILIVLCIKLICTSFELAALIITFILLVVGLAYWIYKEES
jgi:hypothetical protein